MNAAEGLASEAEGALRKARKCTDAAGGRHIATVVAGTKQKHQTGSSSVPDAEVLIMPMLSVLIGSTQERPDPLLPKSDRSTSMQRKEDLPRVTCRASK